MKTAENHGIISTETRENINIQVRSSISLTVTSIFIGKKKVPVSYKAKANWIAKTVERG